MLRKLPNLVSSFVSEYIFTKSQTKMPEVVSANVDISNARARTSFKANITASLAIPEIDCDPWLVEKRKANVTSNTSYLNVLQQWIWPENSTAKCSPTEKPMVKRCFTVKNDIVDLEKKRRNTDDKKIQDKIIVQEVELNANRIKEHAARRADLFFYLLIAVYKTYQKVIKDKTIKQHGKGSKTLATQACHSSLFSNIQLMPPEKSILNFFNTLPYRVLKDTAFEDSLNATVELPDIVNGFDGHLEGRYQPTKYVKLLIEVLNNASIGKLTPKEGMLAYFKIMNVFFGYMDHEITIKEDMNTEAMRKVWQYEQEGTFNAFNQETLTVKPEFFYLMLRLNAKEIAMTKRSEKAFETFYARIQEEIYEAPSVLQKEDSKPAKKMKKNAD